MAEQIGKAERVTQDRVLRLFQDALGYAYLGNWEEQIRSLPFEENRLRSYLSSRGYSEALINGALSKFDKVATGLSEGLYHANKEVYNLLRYGITVREELGEAKQTVWLIDWKNPGANEFAVAEEVTVKGRNDKRPDIVLYVNGIALGVLELKRSSVGVEQGIRQNLDNQKPVFIQGFFTTMQLVMAGNDSQGLRYGTTQTPEKFYLEWKEDTHSELEYLLDRNICQLLEKERFLELVHDFIIFDGGIKKVCRPNQYFGAKAAQENVRTKTGGILWHTQGSGKSLTMVWLTKWIRENVPDSRVLIITDREELDGQIHDLFVGVEERIHRTKSGRDLIEVLNEKTEMLVCSLVHKFGNRESGDVDSYIEELKESIGKDFSAKGDIHVFVDECHRTQSGKLHEAMKLILPDAMFIGFTGTPLLKKDKQKSIEVFGPYIGNPYKFDEAVQDGVVLDLLYEARDVEQFITDQKSIDDWFDAETRGLTDVAKVEIKKKWGTMQKVLGSKSRLEKIVFDIIKDFKLKPRLSNGSGNAMLVSGTVYEACKYYELFQSYGFKECAIITSYEPHIADIKGEETGEHNRTDMLLKYDVYTKMLDGKSPDVFEEEVKDTFKKEPGRMRLLIVVDKLLTGFDAPPATYLYIDKKMQDHGLFQAICRVNRVDGTGKDYGYIVDYKDLFMSLQRSIKDYTSGVFDAFDAVDVSGLLKDRLTEHKERLETALEAVRAICEPVFPRDEISFQRFFCGDPSNPQDIKDTEEKRVSLYKAIASLIRAYTNTANELHKLGYSEEKAQSITQEVKFYSELRDTIKKASREFVDLKRFEPGMRQLMDMYLDANSSKRISDFENLSLVELIVKLDDEAKDDSSRKAREKSVAEKIENNVRRVINDEAHTNPRYYERMSKLLDEIIEMRNQETIDYQNYLEQVKQLALKVETPSAKDYPSAINTRAKQALYDNLDRDESLVMEIEELVYSNRLDGWRDNGIKFKKLRIAVGTVIEDPQQLDELMEIIKAQNEY